MSAIVPIRNKLAYPAGRAPGVDPTHPASRKARLIAVPSSNTFVNLVNGKAGVVSAGAGASTKVSGAGPSYRANTINDATICTFSGFPAVADSENTIAGIYYMDTLTAGGETGFFVSYGAGDGAVNLVAESGNITFTKAGVVSIPVISMFGFTQSYVFVAVSNKDGVACSAVMVDLGTGKTKVATAASSGSSGASDGSYVVANNPFRGRSPRDLLSIMYSPTYLSVQQLLQWAEDPWALWYPQHNDISQFQVLTPPTPYAPRFNSTKRVIVT